MRTLELVPQVMNKRTGNITSKQQDESEIIILTARKKEKKPKLISEKAKRRKREARDRWTELVERERQE